MPNSAVLIPSKGMWKHTSTAKWRMFTFDRTMERCFGASGLIAISFAQFALYATSNLEATQRWLCSLQCFRRHGRFLCYHGRYDPQCNCGAFPVTIWSAFLMAIDKQKSDDHSVHLVFQLSSVSVSWHCKSIGNFTLSYSLAFVDQPQLARASTLALLSMAVIEKQFEAYQCFADLRRRSSWLQS